ncbi:tRNA (adenine(37)-N6)-methyltransferase isoform X2 [Latimeria chalumnae]|uniref:tRNA (adenine(37)-N6)-methyltransferase isoform X2 n=1 Tax=Latimeria chalumnae TaxID=7897 RepID=UPI0003C1AEF0|nr:PREDICTED: nef-associated protein 1 isoform X2 [Latimeria chalumnae]|eukprot:XP_005998485.1 PREDICTED: nef-associated protein 1 isoform X2 [Latimeria chalumnae]
MNVVGEAGSALKMTEGVGVAGCCKGCESRLLLCSLQEQTTLMRKEIKNLRQQLIKATHLHNKAMLDIKPLLTEVKQKEGRSTENHDDRPCVSLERGNLLTVPIGYIDSCFSAKNGTPRQPTVCSLSRARLKIDKTVFNNPEHSLLGLEQFSHVWIIFVFHKNGHLSYKAKVKPPRLNGVKTGVLSTRSPHRPNAIGLTLAKLESIEGDTLHLSGIDTIQGTPVLDVKPYIPEYDQPVGEMEQHEQSNAVDGLQQGADWSGVPVTTDAHADASEIMESKSFRQQLNPKFKNGLNKEGREQEVLNENLDKGAFQLTRTVLQKSTVSGTTEGVVPRNCVDHNLIKAVEKIEQYLSTEDILGDSTQRTRDAQLGGERSVLKDQGLTMDQFKARDSVTHNVSLSIVASWVRQSPVANLEVRFTPHAAKDLDLFQAMDPRKTPFRYLQSLEEARSAITAVLLADPRSVYRRKHCQDQLFYFTLDAAHITCWFGDGFAEILRIKPVDVENAKVEI